MEKKESEENTKLPRDHSLSQQTHSRYENGQNVDFLNKRFETFEWKQKEKFKTSHNIKAKENCYFRGIYGLTRGDQQEFVLYICRESLAKKTCKIFIKKFIG